MIQHKTAFFLKFPCKWRASNHLIEINVSIKVTPPPGFYAQSSNLPKPFSMNAKSDHGKFQVQRSSKPQFRPR